jgi:hypothetical protein
MDGAIVISYGLRLNYKNNAAKKQAIDTKLSISASKMHRSVLSCTKKPLRCK